MRNTAVQISLILLIVGLGSCFRPPEFPNEPQIAFERLRLTDTASLVLTFHVRDGNGDIGLASEAEDSRDVGEPYHPFSAVTTPTSLVTFSGDDEGPFDIAPVARILTPYRLLKGFTNTSPPQPIFEYGSVQVLYFVGDEVFFSNEDLRPSEFTCTDYEIVSFYSIANTLDGNGNVVSQRLVEEVDTLFVQRNEFHFNIFIELQLKNGNDYVPFDLDECDPGYTARFPVFNRSNIGRPLDGSITYAFFSVLFADPASSPLLTATMRIKFYIYDRTLNKSNEVFTPDFRLLDLRNGDLKAD